MILIKFSYIFSIEETICEVFTNYKLLGFNSNFFKIT